MYCFTLIGFCACLHVIIDMFFLWYNDCNFQLAFVEKFGRKLVTLRGKVVWITRVSTYMGKMMALKVAQNHGKLILSSTSLKELKMLKAACLILNPSLKNDNIFILQFDINNINKHQEKFVKVIEHFGKLDILIINEDEWIKKDWEKTTLVEEKLLFQSNVFSVLSLSRLAVKYFNGKEKGRLAITSSIAGLIGVPFSGCYVGTKFALHGYFNGMKNEKIERNIQTTLLCLGSHKVTGEKLASKTSDTYVGTETFESRRKISAERCAHLCLTAVINDLDEVWVAGFPILFLVYGIKYYPNITKIVLSYLTLREMKMEKETVN